LTLGSDRLKRLAKTRPLSLVESTAGSHDPAVPQGVASDTKLAPDTIRSE
jgi:hypothetical protein